MTIARTAESGRPTWIALAHAGGLTGLGDAVRTFSDATTFVAMLDRTRPRIALVMEPPASASVLDHLARERRRRPRLRIVHMTDVEAIDARLRALRLGFDEALPCDIEPSELLGRLALLDERAHRRDSDTIELAGGLELDLVAHRLQRDGDPVHLRPKEFNLLALLASHPSRAYTRRQLLDRVWGHDHVGDPRTVDVHVRWLRAKIETDPSRPRHLVTLRGIGYRLDPLDP